jgi:hypothetical protein
MGLKAYEFVFYTSGAIKGGAVLAFNLPRAIAAVAGRINGGGYINPAPLALAPDDLRLPPNTVLLHSAKRAHVSEWFRWCMRNNAGVTGTEKFVRWGSLDAYHRAKPSTMTPAARFIDLFEEIDYVVMD